MESVTKFVKMVTTEMMKPEHVTIVIMIVKLALVDQTLTVLIVLLVFTYMELNVLLHAQMDITN